MASKSNVLVVANRTALSIGLEAALRARVESGPASFTLVVPLGRTDDSAATAQRMASRLRDVGFDVSARAGDSDPFRAVLEIWSPAEFDEIIVSTLPASTSTWMQTGLPRRIERHTGALVRHVEAREALTPKSFTREPSAPRDREDRRRGISSVVHRLARPGAAH